MAARETGGGLVTEILAAYPGFRAAMARRLADPPREAQLLGYAFVAGLLGFVAGLPAAIRQAAAIDQQDALSAVLAGRLFAALFVFPLFLYLIAALSHLVARAFGGRGSFATARLALVWAVILALPLLLANAALSALAGQLPGAAWGALASGLSAIAALGFAWIWAACLAEAEELPGTLGVFATIVIIPVTSVAILLLFLNV